MRSRLELKAEARRNRVKDKITKPSVVESRDPDAPIEDVPYMRIGAVKVRSENRQTKNARGNAHRIPPPRTR